MGFFVRAVVYGFGFSLGAAIYKRVSDQLGIEKKEQPATEQQQRGTPPPADAGNGTVGADADMLA